jgi:hypothetical protein
MDAEHVVAVYRSMVKTNNAARFSREDVVAELAGHDLACWCPLQDAQGSRVPCHADVLLEIANSPTQFHSPPQPEEGTTNE